MKMHENFHLTRPLSGVGGRCPRPMTHHGCQLKHSFIHCNSATTSHEKKSATWLHGPSSFLTLWDHKFSASAQICENHSPFGWMMMMMTWFLFPHTQFSFTLDCTSLSLTLYPHSDMIYWAIHPSHTHEIVSEPQILCRKLNGVGGQLQEIDTVCVCVWWWWWAKTSHRSCCRTFTLTHAQSFELAEKMRMEWWCMHASRWHGNVWFTLHPQKPTHRQTDTIEKCSGREKTNVICVTL